MQPGAATWTARMEVAARERHNDIRNRSLDARIGRALTVPYGGRPRACWALVGAVSWMAGCTVQPGMVDNDNAAGDGVSQFSGLSPDTSGRLPFAGPCAEFLDLCDDTFPTAQVTVIPDSRQAVTATQSPFAVVVQGSDGDGRESVTLRGSESALGNRSAGLTYSWSSAATDDDPCTLAPGPEFSTEADPTIAMRAGRHLIRLTVRNDLPLATESLPQEVRDQCGTLNESFKFDILELIVEVRD